jgi:hypothetical protein
MPGGELYKRATTEEHRMNANAPENVAVLGLTSLYAVTMLLVWTLWSGL